MSYMLTVSIVRDLDFAIAEVYVYMLFFYKKPTWNCMTPWIISASQTTITFDEQSVLAMVILSSSGASFMSR